VAIDIDLLFVGFGHVGRRFVRLLTESQAALEGAGARARIVGIVTGRHGGVFDPAGLDAIGAADAVERGDALGGKTMGAVEAVAWLGRQHAGARVMIETTPLDIRAGEPAISHVRAALDRGVHVVTANKGPAAFAYRELADRAARAGTAFLFEGAVMDGIPIFNLVRETLPGATIRGFRGVLNSTTNFILSALERGEAFEPALARMQAKGVAEADASLDVDGWDAAAKAAALANVLLDAGTTPHAVAREGVTAGAAGRARAARAGGRRLKLVASGRREHTRVATAVRLEELPGNDPLAILDGQANALELDTWPTGRIVITQRDGGLEKTAYALLSDLVTVVRRTRGDA
jgi:homoserine dehydrogenase